MGGEELLATGFNIATFGEDEAGELYVANYHGDQSASYKMVSRAWHPRPLLLRHRGPTQ